MIGALHGSKISFAVSVVIGFIDASDRISETSRDGQVTLEITASLSEFDGFDANKSKARDGGIATSLRSTVADAPACLEEDHGTRMVTGCLTALSTENVTCVNTRHERLLGWCD